jgi:TolB-like protein/Tfp pilus assembly protein PilF
LKKFIQELQRRNVIKSAISYVVFSWVIIQAASILFPVFDWENSAMQIVLVILIIGFPVWVIFTYIFEWTPTGYRKTDDIPEEASLARVSGKKLNIIIIAGLSLAVILLVTDRVFNFSTLGNTTRSKSIAVLPFENMSSEEDLYFTKGVTQDILTQLSKIQDIRVLSNFTLKDYDTKGKTVAHIGDELGVSYLLTGSVRRMEDQLRISVQLVQISPEIQIWAENFDKMMKDVFSIQQEVAVEVGQMLKATLTPEQQKALSKQPTTNTIAYNYYLKGREEYNTYTLEGMKKAIDYFTEATKLDPKFALAWAGLTDSYAQGAYAYAFLPAQYLDSALVTGKKAVALDGQSVEARKALGLVYQNSGDFSKAKEQYYKALDYNPYYEPALANLSRILIRQGHYDEALRGLQNLVVRNPFSFRSYSSIGNLYTLLEMDDKALEALEKALELAPNDFYSLFYLAVQYAMTQNNAKAKEVLEKLHAIDPESAFINGVCADIALQFDDSLAASYLSRAVNCKDFDRPNDYSISIGMGYILWEDNKQQEAVLWLDESLAWAQEQLKKGNEDSDKYYLLAQNYAIRRKTPEALNWLQKTIDAGFLERRVFMTDNRLKAIREEPRFKQMMQQLEGRIRSMRLKVMESRVPI